MKRPRAGARAPYSPGSSGGAAGKTARPIWRGLTGAASKTGSEPKGAPQNCFCGAPFLPAGKAVDCCRIYGRSGYFSLPVRAPSEMGVFQLTQLFSGGRLCLAFPPCISIAPCGETCRALFSVGGLPFGPSAQALCEASERAPPGITPTIRAIVRLVPLLKRHGTHKGTKALESWLHKRYGTMGRTARKTGVP